MANDVKAEQRQDERLLQCLEYELKQQDERLLQRIKGRHALVEAAELLEIQASQLGEHGRATFWEEIRDLGLKHSPLPEPKPQLIKARPMTDAECREFEKEEVPFGLLQGHRVGDVMALRSVGNQGLSGSEYLRWLSDQTFVDKLRSYLANETIARQG